MGDNLLFKNCSVTTSGMERAPEPCKAVWVLNGLNHETTRKFLVKRSKLTMEIDDGENNYNLKFGLRITTRGSDECLTIIAHKTGANSGIGPEACFDIELHSLPDSVPNVKISKKGVVLDDNTNEVDICDITILKKTVYPSNGAGNGNSFPAPQFPTQQYPSWSWSPCPMQNLPPQFVDPFPKTEDLSKNISKSVRLGIVVTPISCNTTNKTNSPKKAPIDSSSFEFLSKNLGQYYLEEQDNYADLKLESKDGAVLNAHKFILSARSLAFKALIEVATKQNGFDGTIMIKDVNAKPLMALLHWMYTGELQTGFHKFMEELIDAAVKYEMRELLQMLDSELIKICHKGNMLQLYQSAQEYNMEMAVKQISKFIKENL